MATLFSHGATQILAGETDRLLVDPYYVRNHKMQDSTQALLKRWYDSSSPMTSSSCRLRSMKSPTLCRCLQWRSRRDVQKRRGQRHRRARQVWRRIVRAGDRLVIHLINLCGQIDTLWDSPREPFQSPGEAKLQIRGLHGRQPRVYSADPDGSGRLETLATSPRGDRAEATLPVLRAWQLVVVEL